jgi:predicted metal-dependent HD superfamily phosphohydrolase
LRQSRDAQDPADEARLTADFLACVQDADPALALEVGRDLVSRWREPWRRYHDLAHLRRMLDVLGSDAPADVLLAAWYHDAVYDPRAPDNEERSAALAAEQLTRLGVDPTEVIRLVLLTRGHAVEPGDRNGALLCDADLSILAAAPDEYAAYARAVREEYAFVPEDAFRAGRAAILRGLLDLPALFHAHPEWEAPARANLRAELETLSPEAS